MILYYDPADLANARSPSPQGEGFCKAEQIPNSIDIKKSATPILAAFADKGG